MMTRKEMELAVCEKLPELIVYAPMRGEYVWKEDYGRINWPTEGLQVCHEAEKLLTKEQQNKYVMELDCTNAEACGEYYPNITATYEQRLEALCRVWWPERFN